MLTSQTVERFRNTNRHTTRSFASLHWSTSWHFSYVIVFPNFRSRIVDESRQVENNPTYLKLPILILWKQCLMVDYTATKTRLSWRLLGSHVLRIVTWNSAFESRHSMSDHKISNWVVPESHRKPPIWSEGEQRWFVYSSRAREWEALEIKQKKRAEQTVL